MTWHYRILKVGDVYGLHEVYNEDGGELPTSWTMKPVEFSGDYPEEIVASLRNALEDATKRPILIVKGNKLVEPEPEPDTV